MADYPPFVVSVLNANDVDKPVVLVLHGCRQGTLSRGFIDIASYGKKLFKKLSKTRRVAFVFAQYDFVDPDTGEKKGKHWFNKQIVIDEIPVGIDYDASWAMHTLHRLHATIEKYEARELIGFSQGSNVIDTYLAHYDAPHPIDCVVLFSGYGFVCDDRKEVRVPCLMVGCPDDNVVPWKPMHMSYASVEFLEHEGLPENKHCLPKKASVFTKVVSFVVDGEYTLRDA